MFQNTTAVINFTVCSRSLHCIIVLASSNFPTSPKQIYVCSFCTCNKCHSICLLHCSL